MDTRWQHLTENKLNVDLKGTPLISLMKLSLLVIVRNTHENSLTSLEVSQLRLGNYKCERRGPIPVREGLMKDAIELHCGTVSQYISASAASSLT